MFYSNIDSLAVNAHALQITKDGQIFQDRGLKVWYTDTNAPVAMSFVSAGKINGSQVIQFNSPNIDTSRPLTIDPYFLANSTLIGGNGIDRPYAIAVDTSGNIFIAGSTNSTDYPVTAGVFNQSYSGGNSVTLNVFPNDFVNTDMFVSKFTPDLSTLLFSTYIGGTANDYLKTIKVTAAGDIYGLGETASNNFPTTVDALNKTPNGGEDIVLFLLRADGASLGYSTYYGGSSGEDVSDFSLDLSTGCSDLACTIYVAARTYSSDFPVLNAINSTKPAGGVSIVVFKIQVSYSAYSLVFSTYFGGTTDTSSTGNYGLGCFVDSQGNIVVIASANSNDLPTTSNAFQKSFGGTRDEYMFKLSGDGQTFLAGTYLGVDSTNQIMAGGLDANDNVVLVGYTTSNNFPTTNNAYQTSLSAGVGDTDIVVSKVSSDASQLLMSTYVGGNSIEIAFGCAINPQGQIFIGGYTTSSNYPTTKDAVNKTISKLSLS